MATMPSFEVRMTERVALRNPWSIATVFAVGELWGHIGHGVPWAHILLSAGVSFIVVGSLLEASWRK